MEKPIKLSYLLVTRNKLPYLKYALERLLFQRKNDEEILIGDGGSNDGTQEYLQSLKESGEIDFFISEPDHGIAHAFNKLTLLARGILTTFITDDDIYSYQDISVCKSFMLEHPDIDIVCSEGGVFSNFSDLSKDPLGLIRPLNYEKLYQEWQVNHTPFAFCDLGCIFRRSSLAILGLHNPSFYAPDAEYSLRVTANRTKIAWYTGYTYVNISNPKSISLLHMKKIKKDFDRLNKFYLNKKEDSFLLKKIKILRNKTRSIFCNKNIPQKKSHIEIYPELIIVSEKWLEIKNRQREHKFLWNK